MRSVYLPTSIERAVISDTISRVRRNPFNPGASVFDDVLPDQDIAIIKIPDGGIPPLTYSGFDEFGGADGGYKLGKAMCTVMTLRIHNELAYVNDQILDNFQAFAEEIPDPRVPTGDQSFPPYQEIISNPYRWRHFGTDVYPESAGKIMSDGNPPRMLAMAFRERTGLWVCNRPPDIFKAKTVTQIKAKKSGQVTVWLSGVTTGLNEEAWLNWMHSNKDISAGKEVLIRFFEDEDKWVIIGAECE